MARIEAAMQFVIEHAEEHGQKWVEECAMKIATKANLAPSVVLQQLEAGIQFNKEILGLLPKVPRQRKQRT